MTGNPTYSLLHTSLQDFNMSLFKERAVNARKLISLENTILSLKKQIAELKTSSPDCSDCADCSEATSLKEENDALKAELTTLKEKLAALEAPPAPKRRGRRKAQKAEVSDEQK